ncbi:hypothetical protein JI742_02580 [Piscinibacter sp. Jin2]|uniref:Esterase n=1 Tax=Aquariibacter lacus TaxID=2801332 RepID=A0A9X0XD61_9BURK|nr:hypothetical protein [Piscinibacter lacus]MBL0718766.1 hypothetical protein [Piscinibacter lacus]
MQATSPLRRMRTGLSATLAAAAAALLVACGGGGDLVDPFDAKRLFVFGDETNIILGSSGGPAGRRYTVNTRNADSSVNCLDNPIWVQQLGRELNIGFSQCPLPVTEEASPRGTMLATVGGTIPDLETRITTFLAGTSIAEGDLATVYTGQNDLIALYGTINTAAQATAAVATARELGNRLGLQINRLAQADVRVLFGTLPNLNLTPWGRAQTSSVFNPQTVLRNMTEAFNTGLRATVINDGRLIGLVDIGDRVGLLADSPSSLGSGGNAVNAACTTAVPNCFDDTLISAANETNHLWVSDRHFGVTAHDIIGLRAINRVETNPF